MKQWTQIEWLVDGEGRSPSGVWEKIQCAAVASDGHNALAMLVRPRGESLKGLLTRVDDAIRLAVEAVTYTPLFACERHELPNRFADLYAVLSKDALTRHYLAKLSTAEEAQ